MKIDSQPNLVFAHGRESRTCRSKKLHCQPQSAQRDVTSGVSCMQSSIPTECLDGECDFAAPDAFRPSDVRA